MPVNRSFTAHTAFGASHELADHPTCSRNHGHQYTVDMTWAGPPVSDQWSLPVRLDTVGIALGIVHELQSRYLNDMLPATPPSVSGIAGYLLERAKILGVTKVEVHESDTNITGTAEYMDR